MRGIPATSPTLSAQRRDPGRLRVIRTAGQRPSGVSRTAGARRGAGQDLMNLDLNVMNLDLNVPGQPLALGRIRPIRWRVPSFLDLGTMVSEDPCGEGGRSSGRLPEAS